MRLYPHHWAQSVPGHKKSQAQNSSNFRDTELLSDLRDSGGIDGRTEIDRGGQDTDLGCDEELPTPGPIGWFL